MSLAQVLLASPDESFISSLRPLLPSDNFNIQVATNYEELSKELDKKDTDLLYIDDSFGLEQTKSVLEVFQASSKSAKGYVFLGSSNFQEIKPVLDEVKVTNLTAIFLPADLQRLSKNITEALATYSGGKENSYHVDTEFMKHFIDASVDTFSQWTGGEVKAEKPYILSATKKLNIGVRGKMVIDSQFFKGTFFICFPTDSYTKIYSKMTGEAIEKITKENSDLASEFVNIVFGNAKAGLNQHGYDLGMLFPKVAEEKTIESEFDIITIPLNTELGPVYLKICPNLLKD